MLHKVVHFLRGLRAWRFLLRLAVSKNNIDLGLQAVKLVAGEVLRDPAALVRHSHGREGCDIQGTQGWVEVKLKLHLLSNRNRIVDVNVAAYRRRMGPDCGLLLAVPVFLAGSVAGSSPPAGDGKMLNMPVEVLVLVVTMTHETGEKPS